MRKTFEIVWTSFKQALAELKGNKLRTFLSLFGVTIGIFCIIGVLSAVQSLEKNIQDDIKSLGTNTIYIDKWDYSGGPNSEWWKFVNRPTPKVEEMKLIKEKTPAASHVAYFMANQFTVETAASVVENINYYGTSEDFDKIQTIDIAYGRFLNQSDFDNGTPVIIMGNDVAENLFGTSEKALGQTVTLKNKKAIIVGVIKKQGTSLMGGWEYDKSLVMPYKFFEQMFEEQWSQPVIIAQGKPQVTTEALKDELKGSMRNIRRLGPLTEDNFTLNAISDWSNAISGFFGNVSVGGWLIGLLSLIVGVFGIANIMFVTVRERTPYIGLKKAIGAKKRTILFEFLLESAFICIIGGIIGLILVFILAKILSGPLHFNIYISYGIVTLAVTLCIFMGILAGIIPASIAARMDPVAAIRSK